MTDTTISAEDLVSTYESLIKKGILRATGPVEYDRGGCLKCGNVDDHGTQWKSWKYCPKCGGSIKATMSTTNDEQAKYGEPFEWGNPMSDGFVPDKFMTDLVTAIVDNFSDELHNTPDYSIRRKHHIRGVGAIIGALITTGNLRVVEEVELVDGICPSCGYDAGMPRDVNGQDMTPPYCPGCGNKIKR